MVPEHSEKPILFSDPHTNEEEDDDDVMLGLHGPYLKQNEKLTD